MALSSNEPPQQDAKTLLAMAAEYLRAERPAGAVAPLSEVASMHRQFFDRMHQAAL